MIFDSHGWLCFVDKSSVFRISFGIVVGGVVVFFETTHDLAV
ncbi:hypothetical protein HMPREF9999_00349 [Alloprevotella sp. oral taxon 473 str. F0040]|nr:hypothetical protein HMPREF9999_00349 [Alloprevotella sp. oral taxon 473 str. F0040]